MKHKHETDTIKVEMELKKVKCVGEKEETNCMQMITKTTIKDADVFPSIDTEDKLMIARFLDRVANLQKGLFSAKEPGVTQSARQKEASFIHVVCSACGHQFRVEKPCCGEKIGKIKCPECNNLLVLRPVTAKSPSKKKGTGGSNA